MKTIKALIVDDEPLAREIITNHIDKVSNWEIVDTCANADEAYQVLLKSSIDVLFLDIQMPNMSGIDFLKSIKTPPLTILTTAFNEYAIQGFDLNVVDYLLKPILFNRFCQAVEKVNDRLAARSQEKKETHPSNHHFFKHNGRLVKINFEDIIYVKAEQEYSFIHTATEKYLVSMHLKKVEAILPASSFLRIHRSYIIATDKVVAIAGNMVQMVDHASIPIAKASKSALLEVLKIDRGDGGKN